MSLKYPQAIETQKAILAQIGKGIVSVKGKYKGVCNRTACSHNRDVVFYNTSTQAYYCPRCARHINEGAAINGDGILCFKQTEQNGQA